MHLRYLFAASSREAAINIPAISICMNAFKVFLQHWRCLFLRYRASILTISFCSFASVLARSALRSARMASISCLVARFSLSRLICSSARASAVCSDIPVSTSRLTKRWVSNVMALLMGLSIWQKAALIKAVCYSTL